MMTSMASATRWVWLVVAAAGVAGASAGACGKNDAAGSGGSGVAGGGAAGAPGCPPTEPQSGAACTAGQYCLYGDFCCSGAWSCVDGLWQHYSPGCACYPPGTPCSSDAECAPFMFCRLTTAECTGVGGAVPVTVVSGACEPRLGPCPSGDECAPDESCTDGTCTALANACDTPLPCPQSCSWTAPNPCACICETCPPP